MRLHIVTALLIIVPVLSLIQKKQSKIVSELIATFDVRVDLCDSTYLCVSDSTIVKWEDGSRN